MALVVCRGALFPLTSIRDMRCMLLFTLVSMVADLVGFTGVWLVSAQRRRLDGFYARCLRRILRIPPAYLTRVSNAKVLEKAKVQSLSEPLLHRQLLLLGKAATSMDGSPMRSDTFKEGGIIPQMGSFIRKKGWPRQDWTTQLMKEGSAIPKR